MRDQWQKDGESDSPGGPVLRLLRESDLAGAMALKEAAGWNQTEEDWRIFLKLAPEGCIAIEANGRIIATSTALPYEGAFGWIGMVLVHPEERRKGLGSAVFRRAENFLEKPGLVPALDATPLGESLYVRSGFRELYRLERRVGAAPVGCKAHPRCRPLRDSDLAALFQLDRRCFGAGRQKLLAELFRQAPGLSFVYERPGGLEGYISGRRGSRFLQLGPWVAESPAAAAALLDTALAGLAGRLIGIDIPLINPEAVELARRLHLAAERELIRMFKGESFPAGQPAKIFGIAGPEFG
ncbi:MAG: GNAT family N-acetyltransferase [Planctomycetes bacterium]|nr:GNAT family N-acetyltransferase [Planctomycetota bacterium]